MDFLIVTGMSGAGKSQVSHALEDIGFFCIDNIPSELLERFFELCIRSDRKGRYAAVVDVRSHALFGDLPRLKKRMSELGAPLRVLYLDAADEVLCRRYKETRRRHPLMDGDSPQLSVPQAVEQERARMIDARAVADVVLDTSQTSAAQLKERIVAMFSAAPSGGMTVSVMSFGFKYGIPGDADLVFDVRCLPNPHYVDELRPLTGVDKPVSDYVFGFAQSREFYRRLTDLIEYALPLYVQEGKSHLVIAIGCTGGRHRSVAYAEALYRELNSKEILVTVSHRDSAR